MADDITTPTPALSPLEVTLGGTTYPLSIEAPALIRVESFTGRSLLELVEAGSVGALTIADLATIVIALADAGEDDPLFGITVRGRAGSLRPLPGVVEAVGAAIVNAGVMIVTPRAVLPLAVALGLQANAAKAA